MSTEVPPVLPQPLAKRFWNPITTTVVVALVLTVSVMGLLRSCQSETNARRREAAEKKAYQDYLEFRPSETVPTPIDADPVRLSFQEFTERERQKKLHTNK